MLRNRKKTYISHQLSLYIDGQLSGPELREIEQLITADTRVRTEYEELRAMHALLAKREAIEENPYLSERIMHSIRSLAEDDDRALSIPRRLTPATVGLAFVLLAAVATFAWLQRDQLFEYVEDTGNQMQMAYEASGLKGWIMPLFERTDRDEVLHFAMFGTLPLDDEEGTVLRVDEHADSGYRVELARSVAGFEQQTRLQDLYDEIQPSAAQRRVFDTLFSFAQKQIESSVLMNEERELAIDPAISKYHKVILSGIAASLEPVQLERFERYLRSSNTPYTFVSHASGTAPPPPATQVIERFRTVRMPEEFVVFTRDSVTYARLHLDMDSLRRLMKVFEHRMPRFDVRVNDLARTVSTGSTSGVGASPRENVHVMTRNEQDGGHVITISIQSDAMGIREMERETQFLLQRLEVRKREHEQVVLEAMRKGERVRSLMERNVEVHVLPDSEIRVRVEIDSMQGLPSDLDFDTDIDIEFENFRSGDDSITYFKWKQHIPSGKELQEQFDRQLREGDRNEKKRLQRRRENFQHVPIPPELLGSPGVRTPFLRPSDSVRVLPIPSTVPRPGSPGSPPAADDSLREI